MQKKGGDSSIQMTRHMRRRLGRRDREDKVSMAVPKVQIEECARLIAEMGVNGRATARFTKRSLRRGD